MKRVLAHLTDYRDALERQRRMVLARRAGEIPDTLYLVEHSAVITIGRGGDEANLLVSEDDLGASGIELVRTERGGDITYHGPGQVVAYPIMDLRPERMDVHLYIRDLEEVVLRVLEPSGIRAERVHGRTGIWVGRRKIAAIGVRISGWVTSHGFALNYDPDLSGFERIVPCGIRDGEVTSMRRELEDRPLPDPGSLIASIHHHFEAVFEQPMRVVFGEEDGGG